MSDIFGKAEWYIDRPEPEQEWSGVLREREVSAGPASRVAVIYTLVSEDKRLPVYAANVERQLASYVGFPVILRGKLVDLSDEGYEKELWIASIRKVESAPK